MRPNVGYWNKQHKNKDFWRFVIIVRAVRVVLRLDNFHTILDFKNLIITKESYYIVFDGFSFLR